MKKLTNVGTRSLLYGAHCFWLHPWFVFLGWKKLYGWPTDVRLYVAFVIHDWGYWGCPNLDGDEGEKHVEWAANVMHKWFDDASWMSKILGRSFDHHKWHDFCLYHSRFYAKKDGHTFSKLCVADKLAICLEPWWLYLPRVILSGEIKEYMALSNDDNGKYKYMVIGSNSIRTWYKNMVEYLHNWCEENKDVAK